MRILILCTGNSCRSQMAAGFLRSFDTRLTVHSAGTHPAPQVHPLAVRVMAESGIDLSGYRPVHVETFLTEEFDYVITVCESANETCPVFSGRVRHRVHMGFDDPAGATGSAAAVLAVFRRVRDEIQIRCERFYRDSILPELSRVGP